MPSNSELVSLAQGLAIYVTQRWNTLQPSLPSHHLWNSTCQYFLELLPIGSVPTPLPKKKKLAHSTNTHNPLKSVFPSSSQRGLRAHHTYVPLPVPAGMPETWLRTLAFYFGRWPCQGGPEMASDAGTLLSFTAGSLGSLFQKIVSLFTLPAYISQAFRLLSLWATICLVF